MVFLVRDLRRRGFFRRGYFLGADFAGDAKSAEIKKVKFELRNPGEI
jgi:hypothetical protein